MQDDGRRQRRQERRDVALGDQEAVHQPDEEPKPDRRREYYRDHPVVSSREAGRDDGRGRHHRSDGQVDTADQKHEGLPKHDDAEGRRLGENISDVLRLRNAGERTDTTRALAPEKPSNPYLLRSRPIAYALAARSIGNSLEIGSLTPASPSRRKSPRR